MQTATGEGDSHGHTSQQELWDLQTRPLRKDKLHGIYKKYFKLLLKRTSSVQILCNTFSVYTDRSLKKLNSINLLNI